MQFLVTGCAGFIGSEVARRLSSEAEVVGIDNVNDYYDRRLKRYRLKQLTGLESFSFEQIELENRQQIAGLFEEHQFDAVFNLAGRAGVHYSAENPFVYLYANVNGGLNLLEAMRKNGVKKYVLASTSSLYAGHKIPFVESMPVNHPISVYAASKKSAEVIAHAFHHQYGIDVSILRYFSVYGPAGRPDMSYFRFIQNIYNEQPVIVFGDGEQSRDFTYISDIVDGTLLAGTQCGYEIFNLGSGRSPMTVNDLIGKIEKLIGKKATVEYQSRHNCDLDATWADNSKARQQLGWQPSVSIDEGLSKCVNWFLENLPWSANISLTRAFEDNSTSGTTLSSFADGFK